MLGGQGHEGSPELKVYIVRTVGRFVSWSSSVQGSNQQWTCVRKFTSSSYILFPGLFVIFVFLSLKDTED